MDRASAAAAVRKNDGKKAAGRNKAKSKINVLQRDNERLASEANGDLVPVDCMMLDDHHNDKDVPIVSAQTSSLSLLVDVASQQVPSPHLRKKKATKVPCLTLNHTLTLTITLTL
jgi:hypothetical protein